MKGSLSDHFTLQKKKRKEKKLLAFTNFREGLNF